MQTANHHYALRCLAAADFAPSLADKIQAINDHNVVIAKQTTIKQKS
jgi:hypothetical protein